MTDLMNEMTQRMMSEMQEKRDAFIKEMLIKKGYPELAEINEKVRFPKVNRTICDGWEYIFVDDGSKQGKFIVAIGWWEPETKFNLPNYIKIHRSELHPASLIELEKKNYVPEYLEIGGLNCITDENSKLPLKAKFTIPESKSIDSGYLCTRVECGVFLKKDIKSYLNEPKSPELVSFCQTTYTFKWQDSNFDAVRL